MSINPANPANSQYSIHQQELKDPIRQSDAKIYSLVRQIFEGIALILINIVTFGFINMSKSIRDEYQPVFGISTIKPNVTPVKEISNETKKSMDKLFGTKDYFDKLPLYKKNIDEFFSSKDDVSQPIMRAVDKNGCQHILIKLKLLGSKAFYFMHFDENGYHVNTKIGIKELSESTNLTTEQVCEAYTFKKESCEEFCNRTYTLLIREGSQNSLHEVRVNRDQTYLQPRFWDYTDNIRNRKKDAYNPVPEFHKLIKHEYATDQNENMWRLADGSTDEDHEWTKNP